MSQIAGSDRTGIGFIIVLCMLIILLVFSRSDRAQIRDLQRRVAQLESGRDQ